MHTTSASEVIMMNFTPASCKGSSPSWAYVETGCKCVYVCACVGTDVVGNLHCVIEPLLYASSALCPKSNLPSGV